MKKDERLLDKVKQYILDNPLSSLTEVTEAIGCARRTVGNARLELIKEGKLKKGERGRPPQGLTPLAATLTPTELNDIAETQIYDETLVDDEKTRTRILKEVQKLAFNPSLHPDTRMSAMQIWVKIKDIAKQHDVGPGPPRTREEIIDRLVRIYHGVGPKLCIEALQIAFPKEKPDEIVETSTSETTPQILDPVRHEDYQEKID